MKTNLKKLVAGASVLGLVAINSIGSMVDAAMLDNTTATLTMDVSAENDTITVTQSWKDFTWDLLSRVVVKDNAWTTILSFSDSTNVTEANGSFTISWQDLEDWASFETVAFAVGTRYTISFETVAWDLWSAVLVNGTDNQITVSAKVDPVLKFAIQTSSLTFANPLSTTISSSPATGLELGTNAIGGVTVIATSTNWALYDSVSGHKIDNTQADSLYAAQDYQFEATVGTTDAAAWTTIAGLAATSVEDTTMGTTNVKTIYTANKPQNFDTAWDYDVDFKLNAKIAESTPAGNYGDTITFTVTWNF